MKRAWVLGVASIFSLAGEASTLKSAGALTSEAVGQKVSAQLKEGFHFNEKAPNSISVDGQILKPTQLSGRVAEFTSLPKDFSKARATLYVCDDAVTFCEPHVVEFSGSGSAQRVSAVKSKEKSSPGLALRAHKKNQKKNKFGFIEDDLSQALALARKEKKLVLVDFSARWCPGCVRLENEVFGTGEFKKLTESLIKVKLDVDRFENAVLSEKFRVKGIPTLLVVTAEQEEIDRLVDYQPMETLEKFFSSIKEDPTPLQSLLTKARAGNTASRERAGRRLFSSARYEESLEFLSAVQPAPAEYLSAKVGTASQAFSQDAAKKPNFVRALRESIAAESDSSRSVGWRGELVRLLDSSEEIKKIKDEGVALSDRLLSDRQKLLIAMRGEAVGEFTGYEPLLLGMQRADLVEAAKAPEAETMAAWKEAAKIGRELKIPVQAPGPSLRHLIVLIKAREYDEADRLAEALLKRDPGNPEIQRRRLKVKFETKSFKDAIALGEASLKNSYGRNEIWVADLLAKSYAEARKEKEARLLLDKYLSRSDLDWSSVKESRKSMEDLRQRLK